MPKSCCEYERNCGKNEGLKSVEHSPFLYLKKVGFYDDRERENEKFRWHHIENLLKTYSFMRHHSLFL